MPKIVVASKNPVKLNATINAFQRMFPHQSFEVVSASASSGVSDQPTTEKETVQGAEARAENAYISEPNGDYWVGIEGGVEEVKGEFSSFAWISVRDKAGKKGKGRSATFFLPEKVGELLRQGMELGDADDIVFNKQNSKQDNGAIGILTSNVLTRTSYYEMAIIAALIPFHNPDLY